MDVDDSAEAAAAARMLENGGVGAERVLNLKTINVRIYITVRGQQLLREKWLTQGQIWCVVVVDVRVCTHTRR